MIVLCVLTAILRRPGSRRTSSSSGVSAAPRYGDSGTGPASTSIIAAVSRTDRDTTPLVAEPSNISPDAGPAGTRPHDTLSPNRP